MQNLKRQTGMTMWGMLYVVGSLSFVLFIMFKLIPPYLDDLKVSSALESLGRQPNAGSMPYAEIAEAIRKRLEIDSADSFDLSKSLTVEQRGKSKRIRINYESVTPVVSNMSILITFDHSVDVRGGE
jgi:hypothetical protein